MKEDYSIAILFLEKQKRDLYKYIEGAESEMQASEERLEISKENFNDLNNKVRELDKAIEFLKN